jgi:RsiW-degrading membrane proteinase PrsW (M82 family)
MVILRCVIACILLTCPAQFDAAALVTFSRKFRLVSTAVALTPRLLCTLYLQLEAAIVFMKGTPGTASDWEYKIRAFFWGHLQWLLAVIWRLCPAGVNNTEIPDTNFKVDNVQISSIDDYQFQYTWFVP